MSPDFYRSLVADVLRTAGSSQPFAPTPQPPAPAPSPISVTVNVTVLGALSEQAAAPVRGSTELPPPPAPFQASAVTSPTGRGISMPHATQPPRPLTHGISREIPDRPGQSRFP